MALFPRSGNQLGEYLRDRRRKLDPAALGLSLTRRRTPGLRREEVAQRAHVSPTWYTWLEQGRGGAPSADLLERLCVALMLTDAEREHLFLLAFGRPPAARYRAIDAVSPRLQRVLDALSFSPALIKTATWDVVAWNRAAAVMLWGDQAIPPTERNILRRLFCDPRARELQHDWPGAARFVVAAFRADAVRAGASEAVNDMIAELCAASAEFASLWRSNDVPIHGEGAKQLRLPAGVLSVDYSAFAVDGRPDLSLVVFNPSTPADEELIRAVLTAQPVKPT